MPNETKSDKSEPSRVSWRDKSRIFGANLARISAVVILCLLGIYVFLTHVVQTPFPSVHTLDYLSPVMQPFIEIGARLYSATHYAAALAIAAGVIGAALIFLLFFGGTKGIGLRIIVVLALLAGLIGQFLYFRSSTPLTTYFFAAMFFLSVVGSLVGYREKLKDRLLSPTPGIKIAVLLAILFLALLLRCYHLDIIPPGHAQHTAYEHGMPGVENMRNYPISLTDMPMLSRAVSRAKEILIRREHVGITIVWDYVLFSIWEPNLVLQRASSAVLGVIGIYVLFLLASELFGVWAGLLAAFFMTVSPWHITHSRYSSVAHTIALLLMTLTVYVAVLALRRRSVVLAIVSSFLIGFSFYVYVTAQITVFILAGFWLYYMLRHRKKWLIYFLGGLWVLYFTSLVIAPKIGLYGYKTNIKVFTAPIETHDCYSVQSFDFMKNNAKETFRGIFLEGDGGAWFGKSGGFLLWPTSLCLIGGLGWCLIRLWDSRCVLLLMLFVGGVAPTIPSALAAPRRILAANPSMYILAALFASIFLAAIAPLFRDRRRIIAYVVGVPILFAFAAASIATVRYHTRVDEVTRNGGERRIAEIVLANIEDYFTYIYYFEPTVIEKIYVICGKYIKKPDQTLPVEFFHYGDLIGDILPLPKTGPSGAMFLLPLDASGQAMLALLRTAFPGGAYEIHRYDSAFINHDKGRKWCGTYKVPKVAFSRNEGVSITIKAADEKTGEAVHRLQETDLTRAFDLLGAYRQFSPKASLKTFIYLREPIVAKFKLSNSKNAELFIDDLKLLPVQEEDQSVAFGKTLLPAGFNKLEIRWPDYDAHAKLTLVTIENEEEPIPAVAFFREITHGLENFLTRKTNTFNGEFKLERNFLLAEEPPEETAAPEEPGLPETEKEKEPADATAEPETEEIEPPENEHEVVSFDCDGRGWMYYLDAKQRKVVPFPATERIPELPPLKTPNEIPENAFGVAVHKSGLTAITHDKYVTLYQPDGASWKSPYLGARGSMGFSDNGVLLGVVGSMRRIQRFEPELKKMNGLGLWTRRDAILLNPMDIEILPDGEIAALDGSQRVIFFNAKGRYNRFTRVAVPKQPKYEAGFCLDERRNIFICDYNNDRIYWYDKRGKTFAGTVNERMSGIEIEKPIKAVAYNGLLYVLHHKKNSRGRIETSGEIMVFRYEIGAP